RARAGTRAAPRPPSRRPAPPAASAPWPAAVADPPARPRTRRSGTGRCWPRTSAQLNSPEPDAGAQQLRLERVGGPFEPLAANHLHVREAAHEQAQCDRREDPRQRCPETEVDPPAERDVAAQVG